jgi:hypothetical protein
MQYRQVGPNQAVAVADDGQVVTKPGKPDAIREFVKRANERRQRHIQYRQVMSQRAQSGQPPA